MHKIITRCCCRAELPACVNVIQGSLAVRFFVWIIFLEWVVTSLLGCSESNMSPGLINCPFLMFYNEKARLYMFKSVCLFMQDHKKKQGHPQQLWNPNPACEGKVYWHKILTGWCFSNPAPAVFPTLCLKTICIYKKQWKKNPIPVDNCSVGVIINLYKQSLEESKVFPIILRGLLSCRDQIWWCKIHGKTWWFKCRARETQIWRGGLLSRGSSSDSLSIPMSVRQKTNWEALLIWSVLQLNNWETALKHLQWGKNLKGKAKKWLCWLLCGTHVAQSSKIMIMNTKAKGWTW